MNSVAWALLVLTAAALLALIIRGIQVCRVAYRIRKWRKHPPKGECYLKMKGAFEIVYLVHSRGDVALVVRKQRYKSGKNINVHTSGLYPLWCFPNKKPPFITIHGHHIT